MSAKDLTAADISKMLKERERGARVKDLCKKYGISDTTYYSLKRKAEAPVQLPKDVTLDVRDAAVISLLQSLEVTIQRCNTVLTILHRTYTNQEKRCDP